MEPYQGPEDWSMLTSVFNKDIAEQVQWSTTLRRGHVTNLSLMIDSGTNPTLGTLAGNNPLKEIALGDITDSGEDTHQKPAACIRLLIDAGVSPLEPDHRLLTPGDYALANPSPTVAVEMALSILKVQQRRNLAAPFKPRPEILFAFVATPEERSELYARIKHNLAAIRFNLRQRMDQGPDPVFSRLSRDFTNAWIYYRLPPRFGLPRPTKDLCLMYEAVACLQKMSEIDDIAMQNGILTKIREERDNIKDMEWAHAYNLVCKPS